MLLTDKKINHINAIAHDGKIVCFGTDPDGVVWYSIKRSGFEDTAMAEGADPFGFEGWQKLRLGESIPDASVTAFEKKNLSDAAGNLFVRSVYGSSDDATRSADAPVQVVSSMNLLHVFRQAKNGKILVNRFVLDGMTNALVPKLEVRFRRSKQRLAPQKSAAAKDGGSFDNLDYRDMDGNSFFEGALELGFAGTVANGWFAPLIVPTVESDRNRWHLFVYDAATAKLVLYSVGSGDDDDRFDVKDYLFGRQDPTNPENTVYRSIPGILRRTIDLQGLTVAGGVSATTYDLQKEQMTDTGPRLMRDAVRVMLAVPVTATGSAVVKTAVIDFALAIDGTLSQIDLAPDTSEILRSDTREVMTPLALFDGIKEIANTAPPPAGTIVATERGDGDLLQIRSKEALPASLVVKANVKLRGTQSYDGHYKVLSVAGKTFQVAATFANNEAGFWEVADKQTGLVFDNMVVGTEKAADGKLSILCAAHDLKVGDEVQISGTSGYDGIFPITALATTGNGFVLDAPFFTGEAANLSKVVRRGLRMDGNDAVETPELELVPPSPERSMGRTLSAWVRVDAAGNLEQSLIQDSGGLMSLSIGSDNKVKLAVRMSDGARRTVIDPTALPLNAWVHFSGTFDYQTATAGNTRIALYRDGLEVAQQTVIHTLPSHLNDQLLAFDGVDDFVEAPAGTASFAAGITVEAWVYLDAPAEASSERGIFAERQSGSDDVQFALKLMGADHKLEAGFYVVNANTWFTAKMTTGLPTKQWVHVAATYDGRVISIYIDGVLNVQSAPVNRALPTVTHAWRIGRRHDLGTAGCLWKGRIADVRLWNRPRTVAEIAQQMVTRLAGREAGLVGYWPLDNGTTKDLSSAKRNGVLNGNVGWTREAYLYPQIVPPAAHGAKLARVMSFNGAGDYIEVPAYASPTSAITVSLWARSATPNWSDHGCLVSKRNAFMFHPWKGEKKVHFSLWINGAEVKATFTPPDIQQWHCYTGTYDGSAIRFYIDGVQVATAPASGPISADAAGGMCIGHDDGYVSTDRNFGGQIADVQVWSVARATADILAGMSSRFTGRESGLKGYWPLDIGAQDLSPSKLNGLFKGNPLLVNAGSAHTLGQGFSGEIADVQIWDEARAAVDVKATMHLNLSGKENRLAAYYHLGAIVYEDQQPPMVPDFSFHGRNGVVINDPYAGARRLNRATGSGLKVVKYGSDELVAVSQRGVYEETFEFRAITTNAAFNPADADGTGLKLFAFSYWGKTSRGSKAVKIIPTGSVQQSDFVSLGGGWYKATCRVVIPDGMSLLRAFEIADVRGKWGAEAAAPAGEWTAIDVRKHRIRLISNAVTRDSYTDAATLASLPAQSQTVLDNLATMGRAESRVSRIEALIRDLVERIDVAQNNQRYINERNAVTSTLASLRSQKTTAQSERAAIVSDPYSYYVRLRVKHTGKYADVQGAGLAQYPWSDRDSQLFWLKSLGNGAFNIVSKTNSSQLLTALSDGDRVGLNAPSSTYPEVFKPLVASLQTWYFSALGDGYNYILNGNGRVMDVRGGWTGDGSEILHYQAKGADQQRWVGDTTGQIATGPRDAIAARDARIVEIDRQITSAQQRLDWLNEVLRVVEVLATLQGLLTAAQADLAAARSDLAARNTTALGGLTQVAAATMPAIASDDRDLVTTGAVLDFAQPTGRVRLAEVCDGHVLLTYFDAQGRMRATPYDAAADSRNAAFEQWLPDAVRACADVRDSGDKITLVKAVSLPANGWTCEAWVQYPLATKSDGTAYATSVVAAAESGLDAPLMVRKGSRLGVLADGWFFDSEVDLGQTLAPGWHHLAAATSRGTTTFYADGTKLGSRKTSQPVLRFKGSSDYVEVPAHANPTAAITVSIWARSSTPTWSGTGFLASKRDGFVMHPSAGSRTVQFYVYLNGVGWRSVEFAPADIQVWHLYTGTFDGSYLRIYVDGELGAEVALTGAIQAAAGTLTIGYDSGNNAYFNGDIAEVAIWSTARGPSEVRDDLYRIFKGDEPNLFGYWRMARVEEGGVMKVKDLTASVRHGVVKGAPMDATITTMRAMDLKALGNVTAGGSPIGRLAEVRLWNIGFSESEAAAHARGSISGNEPGLLGYWPLDEATGATAFDRSAFGLAHGTMVGVDWMGRTANIGNPGNKVLSLSDRGGASVQCPTVALAGKSFTFECWARRSGANMGQSQMIATMGSQSTNQGFHFGFRDTNKFTLAFWNNDLDTSAAYTDTDWHHWCATYDQPTKKQRIYCDGVMVVERTATADFAGTGTLNLGKGILPGDFAGDLAEVRIWDRARTEGEVRGGMRRRAAGTEPNLLACYPLDEVNTDKKVRDRKTGEFQGQISGITRLLLSSSMPGSGSDHLISAEYSAVEVSDEGRKQALMRRFFGYAAGGDVQVLPEQRVEELTLQWVGNTQINPTLLGYVEGAPPIPSENLTMATDAGYAGATKVTLSQSAETSYSWQRSETHGKSFDLEGFVGVGIGMDAGIGIETKILQTKIGAAFKYQHTQSDTNDTSISTTSTLATTDSLELTGSVEDKAACPAVGKRWVPKNVGYAHVISGMADVFITRLKRSGRMVSYDIRPVEGVPLDVNTITFMINPAYTLNGSLDGMVGSMPADPTFYPHVPDMRSQYGSLYPASYFRLKEAYALKDTIDRQDKERESFFYNFNANQLDKIDEIGASSGIGATGGLNAPSMTVRGEAVTDKDGKADVAATKANADQQKTEAKIEAEKRQKEIEAKHKSIEGLMRADAAFADWQLRMERIRTKAGKRNIVNTYVWDGDGGLRVEEQSFASTIEHSISAETGNNGGAGASVDLLLSGFKLDLKLMGSGSRLDKSSKKLGMTKSLALTVDLSGVEKSGVTDRSDNPLFAGEKVDRYRFMSFYLEGSTDHFNDFFSYVVDPEWLISNDEEARALRMARGAKPNPCWRVLHRVTYVERPVLMALNKK
jgi:Concanavalin A-like lectin/glucanases superfamily/Ricin-type beta-trefoil lectin domain-like